LREKRPFTKVTPKVGANIGAITGILLAPTDEWSQVDDDEDGGRSIHPIEWTGGDEEFSVNITDAEIDSLKDENGEIRYEKVFEWALPRFGEDEQSLFEFQAARMRSYMRKRIVENGWTPKYYTGDRVITADHVTRFYGACLAKCLWEIDQLIKYFVQGKSLMLYH
jgi:hypothetical protein